MAMSFSVGCALSRRVPAPVAGMWWGHSPTWQDGTSMKPFKKFPRGLFSEDCKRGRKRGQTF